MKKIDEDFNNVSMNTVIANKQSMPGNYNGSNFSSFLNASGDELQEEETKAQNISVETQLLHKEAYLNKMMIELSA